MTYFSGQTTLGVPLVSQALRGMGKVPAYTDISHFRAPYKNAMIAGFGTSESAVVYKWELEGPYSSHGASYGGGAPVQGAIFKQVSASDVSAADATALQEARSHWGPFVSAKPGIYILNVYRVAQDGSANPTRHFISQNQIVEKDMTTVAAPPPAPGSLSEAQYIKKDEAKNRFLRDEIKPLVMDTLSVCNAVSIGPGKVQLQRFTPEQIQAAATDPTMKAIIETSNARAWTEREVKAGKVVFMSVGTLFKVMSGSGQFDQYDQLASMEPGKAAQDAAQFPTMVVIGGNPGGSLMAGLGGPVGIALGVLAIGGIAMYLKKDKRGGRRPSAARF